MKSELQRQISSTLPHGKIKMKLKGKKNRNDDRDFEIFICKDGFVEFYDVENPKDGFYFGEFKELCNFADSLNSVLESIPETNSTV